MNAIIKILPVRVLIRLVLDILQYLATKTKNTKDDEIVKAMVDIYIMVLPYIPLNKKVQK